MHARTETDLSIRYDPRRGWLPLACYGHMPLGLATPLGEGGLGLSGGQLQRLAIARAVVGNPRLIVLDKATSHVDPSTERRIYHALYSIPSTRVVIAHRLSTILRADQVVYLVEGQVRGCGSHEELLRDEDYQRFVAGLQGEDGVEADL